MKRTEQEIAEAVMQLRARLEPGQRIYTMLRHRSRSGMLRVISVLRAKGNEIEDISWLVARALQLRRDPKTGGVVVKGVGMDMGFAVVYDLGRALWPEWRREPNPRDPGYALRHEWL